MCAAQSLSPSDLQGAEHRRPSPPLSFACSGPVRGHLRVLGAQTPGRGGAALQRLTLPRLSGGLEVLQRLALSPHVHLWLSSSPRNSFSEGQRGDSECELCGQQLRSRSHQETPKGQGRCPRRNFALPGGGTRCGSPACTGAGPPGGPCAAPALGIAWPRPLRRRGEHLIPRRHRRRHQLAATKKRIVYLSPCPALPVSMTTGFPGRPHLKGRSLVTDNKNRK